MRKSGYTRDKLHELTRQLEVKNFGASRISPFVSRAHIRSLEIHGMPNNPVLQKYYRQNELLKRLERGETGFTDEEAVLLDELAENGYSGVVKIGDKQYKLAGLLKVTGEEFESVLIEERGEGYLLTGETRLDPVTGLKKVYLDDGIIPTLIEIMESVGDSDSVRRIKQGGKAALLEKEGYPLYMGIIWEGKNGDTILWSKEPPKYLDLTGDYYRSYIDLMNASARRRPVTRFNERGYEGYLPGTMLDLEGEEASANRDTSNWAEERPVINNARCVNCFHCALKCPDAVLKVQSGGIIVANPEHCKGCNICMGECQKLGHDAIMMADKDLLEGIHRRNWLDRRTSWQTGLNGGLANHLYTYFTSKLGDKDQILLDDFVVTVAYSGKLPIVEYETDSGMKKIGGDSVLQLRLLRKDASKGTKPLVYTFIKGEASTDWKLVVKPQRNILVMGTGETEARIAIESIRKGFEVRVVQRFSTEDRPVYYNVEELEKYNEAFRTAGLRAGDEFIKDIVGLMRLYELYHAGFFPEVIAGQITSTLNKLGTQLPDYLVTGQTDLISEVIIQNSVPITGQPVIAPGDPFVSHDNDLDGIIGDVYNTIPRATLDAYARHADIKIPRGDMARLAEHIIHFAGGHGLCTGCDAGIIANKVIAAAVASEEKLGKKVRVAFVGATGCLEVSTTTDLIAYGPKVGPKHRLQISYLHSAFTNLGASISGTIRGWEQRKACGEIPKDEELIVVGVGGDGGTHDIGFQALSGAWERGEKVFYIEYDNGAYMNTGIQRSSATPEGAWTTTSPHGKLEERKDLAESLAAHMRDSKHLVMTSSTHDMADFMGKLEQGILHSVTTGPAFLSICATCVPGHRLKTPALANKTNQIASETASFVSYTIKDGLLELASYTPEVPEFDPAKGDYKFRYRYKGREYTIYGDDYIKQREDFSRMHEEDGGRNIEWITTRPVIDRLWAEGRFKESGKREDLAFINELQRKIIERLQDYHYRNRNTKRADKVLRTILDTLKKSHPKWKDVLFQAPKDARDLEKDIYADIRPQYRELIGEMRRLLASNPVLESIPLDGRLEHLLRIIPIVMMERQPPEDGMVDIAKSVLTTVQSVLLGKEKLPRIKIEDILRGVLNHLRKYPQYKNLFQKVKDIKAYRKDPYADVKAEHRGLIEQIRILLADTKFLEQFETNQILANLTDVITVIIKKGAIPEENDYKVLADSILGILQGLRVEAAAEEEAEPQIVTDEQKLHNNRILANELVNVAWKSRGGKGAIMANKAFAKLLLYMGGYESDFPYFGPERQGAPVEAFLVASGGEIQEIGTPLSKDFTIVLDEKAWGDKEFDYTGEELPRFLHGQAEDGVLLVNTTLTPEEVRDRYKLYGRWSTLKIYTIDANGITARHGGDASKPNMTLLGAALRAFQYFGIQYNKDELFKKAASQDLVGKFGHDAVEAFKEAHENIVEEVDSPKTHKARVQLQVGRIMDATAERFPEGKRLEGNEAAAKFYVQIAHFLPLVFATYPITPTTAVGEIISGAAVYNRKLGRKLLEYLAAESEHSAMSACVAAALAGSVAGFATGSQGLAYAWEAMALADDLRAAGVVVYVGNRAINAPLNILYDRSDSDTLRHNWLEFVATTQQEVYDYGFIALLASYLARRPAKIDYAAFFLTHTGSNVKLLNDEEVQKITDKVKEIKARYETTVDSKRAWGIIAHDQTFEERNYGETESVEIASQRAILDAFRIFSEITGRDYSYFNTPGLEDAEYAVAVLGAHSSVVQKAIDDLREEGIKVGMFSPRVNNPFTGDVIRPSDVARILGDKRHILVIEHFNHPGNVYSPLASKISNAIASQGKPVPSLMNWIMALGGRTLDVNKVKELIKMGIILGGSSEVTVDGSQMDGILANPEVKMAINRLVSIYEGKLKRNYSHYTDIELAREKEAYRKRITEELKNREYTNFLGHKEYADVRREGKELEVKFRLIRLIEITLARQNFDSAEGDAKKYWAEVLYYLSRDFRDQDRTIKATSAALLCMDRASPDELELTPYEGKQGVYIGREKGAHKVGYHAASIKVGGQDAVALNPTFIEYLRTNINRDKVIEAAIFHEQNEEALGHDEVLRREKEQFGVSPVDPAYSLAQHYAILNEVETYGLPELTKDTEFIHQYYRRYLLVTGLFKAGTNPGFVFEDYRRIIHAFYIDKGMTPPSDSVLSNDLDLFLRSQRLIRIGNIYFQNGKTWEAIVAGIKAVMTSVIRAIVDFAGMSELIIKVVDRGIEVTKQNGHVRDPSRTETREFQSLYISHILKAAGLPEIKIRENTTAGQWEAFINRLFLISRCQSVDPYLGQAFSEWRGDRLKEITQPRTILFTLEALEDNIYDAPARALIERLTSSNITIAIATVDEKDARTRLERKNFPITADMKFITYTDQPDVSRFGLSPDFTVLAYNKDLKFVNTAGFKAVEISRGVSLPQAFTFIIGLFNKPLEEVVRDLKAWLESKGFSKDEIEEIVRAIPEEGIILPLPAVKRLTDDIQADKSDAILVSA